MEHIYYIPISADSLAHYLSKALILPSKYLLNKLEDIQNKLKYSILLSKIKWTNNSNCSIEIVLTTEEERETNNLSDNFLQLNIPLPISRIKKIHFLDEKQMETTVWNINNGAAFIPQNLIAIENKANIEFNNEEFHIKETLSDSNNEIDKKIKRFDTLLGGFAFMKVSGKNFGAVSANFSENYFITLSTFNKTIEEQTIKAEKEKKLNFSKKYIGLFSSNNSEWSEWQPYIYKYIELQDVEEIAEKDGLKIEKKLGQLNIDSIDKQSHLYDIAILATYGDRKSKSIDDLVNSLHNRIIPESKVEDIAILFGLNTGYTKFRNKYNVGDRAYSVKFKLDNKLDYYTIESIYQFSFHNTRNNSKFEFIDRFSFPKVAKTNISGFETYTILDQIVIAKKKQTPLELFLEKYSNGIYEKLSQSAKQLLPSYAVFDSQKAIKYFKDLLSENFISALKQYEESIRAEYEERFNHEKDSHDENILLLQNKLNDLEKEIETNQLKIQLEEKELISISNPSLFTKNEKDYEEMSLTDPKKQTKGKETKASTKTTKKKS